MAYRVLLGDQPREFLERGDDKTERIVKDHLAALGEEPYPKPNSGRGDREQLPVDGREMYRMHISRTYTVLYTIDEPAEVVRVREILPIADAHRRYGY